MNVQTTPPPPDATPTGRRFWQSIKYLWCRHRHPVTTPRTATMPAHRVCPGCGWREPVPAPTPQATRTWDSTRDEVRYQLEKKRRAAVEEQRQQVVARLASPPPRRSRRARGDRDRGTLLHMKPAVGE